MRVKVVQLLGKVYVDVLVDVDLPDDPTYGDFVAAVPAAAAAAAAANPAGRCHFHQTLQIENSKNNALTEFLPQKPKTLHP